MDQSLNWPQCRKRCCCWGDVRRGEERHGSCIDASGIAWRRYHFDSPCESSSVSDELARHVFGGTGGNGTLNNREDTVDVINQR